MKKAAFIFLSGLLVLTGCAKRQSPYLTRVPQEALMQAQLHPQKPKKHLPKPIKAPEQMRAELLNQQSPEIRKAFLAYEKTGKAPIIQANDFLQFPYREDEQPIVTCEPLHACEIQLEEGEVITGLLSGDTVRWIFSELYSGMGENRQPHVIAKPKAADISTNIVIATSKRIYHIGLLSKSGMYVKQAKFYYPQEMLKALNEFNASEAQRLKDQDDREVASLPMIDLTQVDDHYSISASSDIAWKPIRAFNDGTHVYIQMPEQIRVTSAPVIFINQHDHQALVNYRIKDNYYIVDTLFRQAVMLTGVGRSQEKVEINYIG